MRKEHLKTEVYDEEDRNEINYTELMMSYNNTMQADNRDDEVPLISVIDKNLDELGLLEKCSEEDHQKHHQENNSLENE